MTDEYKETHMGSSLMHHHNEEHCEAFLSRIAKGDVTWVFHYIPDNILEASSFSSQKEFQASAVLR